LRRRRRTSPRAAPPRRTARPARARLAAPRAPRCSRRGSSGGPPAFPPWDRGSSSAAPARGDTRASSSPGRCAGSSTGSRTPSRPLVDGRPGGPLRHTVASPAHHVGAEEVVTEDDLDLGREPPASWPTTTRASAEAARKCGDEVGLCRPVFPGRRTLLDDLGINELVPAVLLRDCEEILD